MERVPRAAVEDPNDEHSQEWGELYEEFDVQLGEIDLHVKVYRRELEDNWYLYTTVNDAGEIINCEASPRKPLLID